MVSEPKNNTKYIYIWDVCIFEQTPLMVTLEIKCSVLMHSIPTPGLNLEYVKAKMGFMAARSFTTLRWMSNNNKNIILFQKMNGTL